MKLASAGFSKYDFLRSCRSWSDFSRRSRRSAFTDRDDNI